ncbi:hypothetical protein DFH11DRAFT_153250 [Phellopilus nigrolimitatus]|nr:hypothetical protein DFH11DRAFT_153250 [Phellopilus nigrolimitatus]
MFPVCLRLPGGARFARPYALRETFATESRTVCACRLWCRAPRARSLGDYLRGRQLEHARNVSKIELTTFVSSLCSTFAASCSLSSVCSPVFLHIRLLWSHPRTFSRLFSVSYYLDYRWRTFGSTYAAYLRTSYACKHLLLSYVCLQVAQAPPTAAPVSSQLSARLPSLFRAARQP